MRGVAVTSRFDWLVFVLLSFMWGSSYVFIKIAVDEGVTGAGQGLPPFTLVTLRLLIGVALLAAVVVATRAPLPRDARTYAHLVGLALVAVALPFFLITWAEQHVDSALAATLTAPVPLFVIPIAALMLADERMSLLKIAGVAIGLVGVAILVGFDPAQIGLTDFAPQLALVAAALSYAFAGVYARRFVHGLRPMVTAVFQVGFAMLMSAAAALVFENPVGAASAISMEGLVSVVWLGLFGSGMAYLLFYWLLGRWGATRTSLVAYALPVWGIALGWLVLREQIHESLLLGTALIIAGIALVNNVRPWTWRRIGRASIEQGR